MKQLFYRHSGKIAAAIVLGAALFLGGQYLNYSQAATLATPVAASPATPVALTPAPGFTAVANAVTPAVVNITSHVARMHDRGSREPMAEFFRSPVALGIVSALGRGHMGITQYEDFIQTDAAINPGNSGGALVNTAGELVGINTAIVSQTGGYQGVGFAVPANMAKPVYESLVKTGKVVRGYLGIAIQELTQNLAKSFGLKQAKGALVSSVAEDSPAERAGIKQGDVIVAYQGNPIEDPAVLQREATRTPVGTKATLKIIRARHEPDGSVTIAPQSETAKVASADSSMENALAGVEVQSLDLQTARELGLHGKVQGVVVVIVEPDSLADRAGLAQGDVIKEINRQPIKSVRDYEKIVSNLKKDESVLLLINRSGASLFITVKA